MKLFGFATLFLLVPSVLHARSADETRFLIEQRARQIPVVDLLERAARLRSDCPFARIMVDDGVVSLRGLECDGEHVAREFSGAHWSMASGESGDVTFTAVPAARKVSAQDAAFLDAPDFKASGLALQSIANKAVEGIDCVVDMSQLARPPRAEAYSRTNLELRLRCAPHATSALFTRLSRPEVFVEDISIWRQNGYRTSSASEAEPYDDVHVKLFGYRPNAPAAP